MFKVDLSMMATRRAIKSFQFIQTIYQTSGIYTPQAKQYYSLNGKVLLILLSSLHFAIASFAYLIFEAESIGDMAYSYCLSLSLLLCFIFVMEYTLKIPNVLMLIEKFDEFIRKRKLFSFVFCVL